MNDSPANFASHEGVPRRLDSIVGGIAERITGGRYRPGERLPSEVQLQQEWNVSRSVVREAMKVLAAQGLVRIEQGRGTFVNEASAAPLQSQIGLALRWISQSNESSPNGNKGTQSTCRDDWDHLIEVRRVLEIAVAERAAQRASEADCEAMQVAIQALRKQPEASAGYVDADVQFHSALAESTGNPLWPALLNSLNDLLRRYREEGFRGKNSALLAARQHQKILDAVRARDAVAAQDAMCQHLKRSEHDLRDLRKKKSPI